MFTSLSVLHCHSQNLEIKKKKNVWKVNQHSFDIHITDHVHTETNKLVVDIMSKKSKASTLHARNICTSLNRRFHLFCFFLLVFEKLIFILENVENDMVKPSVSNKAQLYKVANTI
jgi:hypothetical protein